MSNAERRRHRKEQKARQQTKKDVRLQERQAASVEQVIAEAHDRLRTCIASGQAKIAVASINGLHEQLIVAMWETTGVLAKTYQLKQPVSLTMLVRDVEAHGVDSDEWLSFFDDHMASADTAGPGQMAISLVQWRAGEGPGVSATPPTMALPSPG